MKDHCGPSVKTRSTDAAIRLDRSEERRGRMCGVGWIVFFSL